MRSRVLAILAIAFAASAEAALSHAAPVDFARDVAPLLQSRCLGCHGQKKQEGGLRLDSRERVLAGSNNGPVVVSGNSAGSRLVRLIADLATDSQVMPPEGTKLSAAQVATIKAWIDQGLPWPEDVALDLTPAEIAARHWAFRPLVRPDVPQLKGSDGVQHPLDAFILARLEHEGIASSPPADRRTLIRRVTLDLTGLLPSPAEVQAFVGDDSPDAYDRRVDRLLASPHYGERWARPWLDLCHYGDTDGYLTDQLRPVAWRYRQWLIEALNADLPFDQFTIQQLAGDLLPDATESQRIATGFLRNTLSNREGGADLEEFRVEQVVDRASMVGTTWLGLTVGCARCHDHKYDPIAQRDFYGLYAFFDAADETNIDAPLPGEREPHAAKLDEYNRRRAELIAPQAEGMYALQKLWEQKMLHAVAHPGEDYLWDRQWEVLGLIWGGNLGEGQLEGCEIVLLPWEERTADQRDRLLDYFLQHGAVTDGPRFTELKLAELQGQLAALKKELPPLTRAPAMRQTRNPRRPYIHVRGDFRVRGDDVAAAAPEFLPHGTLLAAAAPSNALEPPAKANRLDLARWLVSAENPLTARVTANRAWQEFFGRGIVFTSENFGLQGERPSHPELLDWLAAEFIARGWSVKQLHRLIVTSATYRQSSRTRPELLASDPENRLLARQSALRLSAEQVRDATLSASGLLQPRIGGPSVFPQQPASVAKEGFESTWTASSGGDQHRRGLYTWHQRLSPFAQNVTFDAPSSTRVCARRERSNTPLQALTLLNYSEFWDASRAMAQQIVLEETGEFDKRLDQVFMSCLGRGPQPAERQRLTKYYEQQSEALANNITAAITIAGIQGGDYEVIELAAWTELCSIVLNLHEFITRD